MPQSPVCAWVDARGHRAELATTGLPLVCPIYRNKVSVAGHSTTNFIQGKNYVSAHSLIPSLSPLACGQLSALHISVPRRVLCRCCRSKQHVSTTISQDFGHRIPRHTPYCQAAPESQRPGSSSSSSGRVTARNGR